MVSYSHSIATMAISLAVYEIFSVKEWRDLELGVRGCSRSLKMAPFDRPHATFYWSVIVSIKVKVKVWTLAIAPLTRVRLVTSSALQSRKWQLIGMSQWCRSALCGHPLPALTDNWTNCASSRHSIAPISHTWPLPCSRSYYSFSVPPRVGGWVSLSTQ